MKTCSRCNTKKPLNYFGFRDRNHTRYTSFCKQCHNSYTVDRWINRKKDAIKHMGSICADCKTSYHYAAMQFHHIDPNNKEFVWDKLRKKNWNSIVLELNKCILLCANCHLIRHSNKDQ